MPTSSIIVVKVSVSLNWMEPEKVRCLKILSRITEPTAGGAYAIAAELSFVEARTGFHWAMTGRRKRLIFTVQFWRWARRKSTAEVWCYRELFRYRGFYRYARSSVILVGCMCACVCGLRSLGAGDFTDRWSFVCRWFAVSKKMYGICEGLAAG